MKVRSKDKDEKVNWKLVQEVLGLLAKINAKAGAVSFEETNRLLTIRAWLKKALKDYTNGAVESEWLDSTKKFQAAVRELEQLLRASATGFISVWTTYDPPTLHVYWKKSTKKCLPFSKKRRDGFNGFPITHHFSRPPGTSKRLKKKKKKKWGV